MAGRSFSVAGAGERRTESSHPNVVVFLASSRLAMKGPFLCQWAPYLPALPLASFSIRVSIISSRIQRRRSTRIANILPHLPAPPALHTRPTTSMLRLPRLCRPLTLQCCLSRRKPALNRMKKEVKWRAANSRKTSAPTSPLLLFSMLNGKPAFSYHILRL
jgi:hypothetical protein